MPHLKSKNRRAGRRVLPSSSSVLAAAGAALLISGASLSFLALADAGGPVAFAAASGTRTASEDGGGVLISDLLSQPFSVSLLRSSLAGAGQSTDFGFALATDDDAPQENPYNDDVTRRNIISHRLAGPIFANPFARSSSGAVEKSGGANATHLGAFLSAPPPADALIVASPLSTIAPFSLRVSIGKYDGLDLIRARRPPRATMKAGTLLAKSRYGELRDTALSVSLFRTRGGVAEEVGADAEKEKGEKPLMSLLTIDPYLPRSRALLGGRIGASTQADRFRATGHAQLDGLMSADGAFWRSLVAAAAAEKTDGTAGNSNGATAGDASLVHGLFTLTFANRQEFTLRLRLLPPSADDKKSTAPSASNRGADADVDEVTFYGVATPPVLPSDATVASTVAAMLGLSGGGARVASSASDDNSTKGTLLIGGILETLFAPSGAAFTDPSTAASAATHPSLRIPATGNEAPLQRAAIAIPAAALPSAFAPSITDRAFAAVVETVAWPFAYALRRSFASAEDGATATPQLNHPPRISIERIIDAEEEARRLVEALSMLSTWSYNSWPLLVVIAALVLTKAAADVVIWGKERRIRREREAKAREKAESDARLAALMGR